MPNNPIPMHSHRPCHYCVEVTELCIDTVLPPPIGAQISSLLGGPPIRIRMKSRSAVCEPCLQADVTLFHLTKDIP